MVLGVLELEPAMQCSTKMTKASPYHAPGRYHSLFLPNVV